jgi:hypothetical protein
VPGNGAGPAALTVGLSDVWAQPHKSSRKNKTGFGFIVWRIVALEAVGCSRELQSGNQFAVKMKREAMAGLAAGLLPLRNNLHFSRQFIAEAAIAK